MANLTKLEFIALHSSGKNYLSWVLDAEIHLDAMGLGDTIKEENKASKQNYARAMIFLRHHLDKILKIEYLTVKARYDWMHLRLQDFKSIYEYNSAMFRITSQLKLCGETVSEIDMMEKTFSIFHASNVLLQEYYREKGFKNYSELIPHLLVAEQNNGLLMKNHENRPTGSEPLPEVNEAYVHHARHGKGRSPNLGCGHGHDYGQECNSFPSVNHLSNKNHNQKEKRKDEKREATWEGSFRCGGRGHYARDCRTPKLLVELYQKSLKKKVKNPEANFVSENQVDITHLDVADFFTHPEGKIDHLIGDDYVNMKE